MFAKNLADMSVSELIKWGRLLAVWQFSPETESTAEEVNYIINTALATTSADGFSPDAETIREARHQLTESAKIQAQQAAAAARAKARSDALRDADIRRLRQKGLLP